MLRNVTLGDGDEARETRLRRQQIVERVVERARGPRRRRGGSRSRRSGAAGRTDRSNRMSSASRDARRASACSVVGRRASARALSACTPSITASAQNSMSLARSARFRPCEPARRLRQLAAPAPRACRGPDSSASPRASAAISARETVDRRQRLPIVRGTGARRGGRGQQVGGVGQPVAAAARASAAVRLSACSPWPSAMSAAARLPLSTVET